MLKVLLNKQKNLKLKKMAEYNVVFEINIDGSNPKDAAKRVDTLLKDREFLWQYYVQEESGKIFFVDLSEDDIIHEVDNYIPLIK